jgi:thioredoxin-dependent peroxiredoxin
MTKTSKTSKSEKVGQEAPDFSLIDQHGKTHRLADYTGRWLVVYFYPKDSTPGCTLESCGFRDHLAEFEALNASVVGMSILDVKSKAKFAGKYHLNFPLLADEDNKVSEAFGVWGKKSMFGITFMGISRETFLISPQGEIAAHWPKAKGSANHPVEVLETLRCLLASSK